MRTQLASALFALAVAACGQTTVVEPAPVAEEAPAPVAQSAGGECRGLQTLAPESDMQAHGVAAGYTVSATPGALACSEPGLEGAVECAFTGPGEAHVSAQDTAGYALDAGQTATLVIGPNGPSCFINANGG